MKRVAIFIDDFSATGVVNNAIAIACHLRDRGCVVQLIAAQAEGALICNVPKGISVVGLLPSGKGSWSRQDRLRRSIAAFRSTVKAFAPDVLFSAGNHGHLISSLVSIWFPRCRTLVRVSNDLDQMINGKPHKPFSRWWRISKFRVVAALADKLVFVSRHMARSKAVLGTAAIRKAVIIPNGVDVAAVRAKAKQACSHDWLADRDEIPVVLAVGRLTVQKNFANLLQAVAIARHSRPIRLLLIGSGPLRQELQRKVTALGLSDIVQIMKPVANPMPFLARASVVAVPSWWEGSSNVLLEALACGTPVVASRTAGNAEDILDFGRYGLLIDPHDAEGLAAALLVQTSQEAQRPGDRALEFSREATMRAYGDLILEQSAA
jgi:glycosyltransferase involved in cell wall biosynthesis